MDLSRYAALFLTESREQLGVCNRLLLEWERDPSATEPVAGLFRAIHTIKGMAATMAYARVAELAHRTEHLLDALRTGRIEVGGDVVQLLFLAVDALIAGVEAAADGRDDAIQEGSLLEALDHAAAGAVGPRAATGEETGFVSGDTLEHPILRPDATAPVGEPGRAARTVRVTIRPGTTMRGARALLALRRAERLGQVTYLQPPAAQFERDDFDGQFGFRLETASDSAQIVAAIRAAGEVAEVVVEQTGAEPAGGIRAGRARGRQIRIELSRLDSLMKQAGELVVAKNRLVELSAASGAEELDEVSGRIARLVASMQAEIVLARMTPVGEVFERFPRLIRDLARELGKQIAFEVEGDEIELDRSILDEIGEPLVHLIRNAADHGLEPAAERVAAGKPPEGRLLLSATRERNSVAIRVSDNGRGIDPDRVLAKARSAGLADASVTALGPDQLLRVLARPGFSTAQSVSGVSGRGVGIDAVLTRARALGGTLELESEPGRGTTWTLRVPLTLAIVRALLTRVGTERYAVPLAYVAETVEFDQGAVTALQDREALLVRDAVVPTLRLEDLVSVSSTPATLRRPTVILEVGQRRAALVVDALLGQQDIIVEPFEIPRGMPPFFGGATILADGVPALILDAAALV